jgi:hypothetical protein
MLRLLQLLQAPGGAATGGWEDEAGRWLSAGYAKRPLPMWSSSVALNIGGWVVFWPLALASACLSRVSTCNAIEYLMANLFQFIDLFDEVIPGVLQDLAGIFTFWQIHVQRVLRECLPVAIALLLMTIEALVNPRYALL